MPEVQVPSPGAAGSALSEPDRRSGSSPERRRGSAAVEREVGVGQGHGLCLAGVGVDEQVDPDGLPGTVADRVGEHARVARPDPVGGQRVGHAEHEQFTGVGNRADTVEPHRPRGWRELLT